MRQHHPYRSSSGGLAALVGHLLTNASDLAAHLEHHPLDAAPDRKEAMEFACELLHTSKAFHTMVCNRLEVICHEDLDTLAAPHVFPFVAASLAASRTATRSRSAKPG
jgi:hypothetical protein